MGPKYPAHEHYKQEGCYLLECSHKSKNAKLDPVGSLVYVLKEKIFFLDLLVIPSCSRLCFPGEWQTRFDPQGTTKGAFYLDNQNSVSVDMMKSAQYPLRLLHDPELDALVMGGLHL